MRSSKETPVTVQVIRVETPVNAASAKPLPRSKGTPRTQLQGITTSPVSFHHHRSKSDPTKYLGSDDHPTTSETSGFGPK